MSGGGGRRGNPEQRHARGDRDPYEVERRRQRRRRQRREAAGFDPSPPEEGDYVAPDRDRLRRLDAPQPLDEVLEGVVDEREWSERLRGSQILGQWPRVVGDEVARHCEPVRLSGGILVVRARSQAWATELNYLRGRIRSHANALVDGELVRQVQIVVGELDA